MIYRSSLANAGAISNHLEASDCDTHPSVMNNVFQGKPFIVLVITIDVMGASA